MISIKDNCYNKLEASNNCLNLVEILSEYAPLVKSRASYFSFDGCELEDLIQEGNIGLISAYLKHDDKLSSFSTFSRKCVDSAIIDYLRKNNKLSNIPKNMIVDIDGLEVADFSQSPEHYLLINDEYKSLIKKAKTQLSKFEFSVFSYTINGYSASEIANKLSVTIKSVRNAICRIRTKLK